MKNVIISILILATFSSDGFSQESNAGILTYTHYQGKVMILLSRSADSFWTDFIGGYKCIDRNDIKKTALREFIEETRGAFDFIEIWGKLKNEKPLEVYSANTYRFVIEVHHISENEIESLDYCKKCEGDTEKKEYLWVDLNELLATIDKASKENRNEDKIYLSNSKTALSHDIYRDLRIESETRKVLNKIKNN